MDINLIVLASAVAFALFVVWLLRHPATVEDGHYWQESDRPQDGDDLILDDIAEMPYYVDRRTSGRAMDEAIRRVDDADDTRALTAMYFVVLNEWGY